MIPESEWKWFGTAAHFICTRSCHFHMATQVGSVLVSTVGNYVSPLKKNEYSEIGYQRMFETMVFKAGTPCSLAGCDCGLPEIDGNDIDFQGYNTAGAAAAAGHLELCKKYAAKQ